MTPRPDQTESCVSVGGRDRAKAPSHPTRYLIEIGRLHRLA
jgi:hypothetical protein